MSRASVSAVRPNQGSRWFLRFKDCRHPEIRLFCFPYAGGSASVFRRWPMLLQPEVDLLAVQLPGRGNRLKEAIPHNLHGLAEELADEVLCAAGDIRFAFFGHSLGALLLYEVTRCLERRGAPLPQGLLVSGRPAPNLPLPQAAMRRSEMSDNEFVAELRRLNGTPEEVLANPELLAFLMPILRGDFALLDNWVFQTSPPLHLPIMAFAGREDAHVSVEAVRAWEDVTLGAFELLTYGGGHFFLHEDESRFLRDISQGMRAMLCG